ncbi:hypothetical protein Tco_0783983, partial [Tanacetum coccineum]
MEDTLSKFMSESAKRHEENSNLIKEIRAATDAAIRNQGASIKTLEIQIGKMSKVLQKRGFVSLPSLTETNPRDHVKSISTTIEADSYSIRRASVSVMPLLTYLNLGLGELAYTMLIVELADMTVKYPKGIAENVLVGIGKFTFLVDFIILDMPKDIKVPLCYFLSLVRLEIYTLQMGMTRANQAASTSANPPIKNDWDVLFQPMFDEYFKPLCVVSTLISVATLLPPDTVEASLSSTSIDKDAPSPSTSPNNETTSPPINSTNGEEPHNEEVAEFDIKEEPKNYKEAMIESSWIEAMQEEIHEFERLEVCSSLSVGVFLQGENLWGSASYMRRFEAGRDYLLDMAHLPPREKRHPFLKYQGLEYTDADIVDFEERMRMEHRDDP